MSNNWILRNYVEKLWNKNCFFYSVKISYIQHCIVVISEITFSAKKYFIQQLFKKENATVSLLNRDFPTILTRKQVSS